MKIKSCGWRTSCSLGRRSYGRACGSFNCGTHSRGKRRAHGEGTAGVYSYMDRIANAASLEAFRRKDIDPLLSAEALPENSSLIDFKAFARDYPDKLAPLLANLRPEFLEFFVEYYLLEKSQTFIGKTHGCVQTRIWQNLRVIEQSIGSMILLGTEPDAEILRPILRKANLEDGMFGNLADMIRCYAASRSYTVVAEKFHTPVPTIRKIFRPAIKTLLADKDVKAVAVGAYLRSLTHQASLTGAGLGKRYLARLKRAKVFRFDAPPADNSPILSFGPVSQLCDTPWCMLEISSDHRMLQIAPALRNHGKKLFAKHAAQIFAPTTDDGELAFGYIFARCTRQSLVRGLLRVRGISEIATLCDDEGNFVHAITVPDADVREMMKKSNAPPLPDVHPNDFVEILTGPAAHYCGTVTQMSRVPDRLTIEVRFPTGKRFVVKADPSCVKPLPECSSPETRQLWGARLS
jgi:hypothetical protein